MSPARQLTPEEFDRLYKSFTAEDAVLYASARTLIKALKLASDALASTLKARGYVPGSDISSWAPEVQGELRALVKVRAALAKAAGSRS